MTLNTFCPGGLRPIGLCMIGAEKLLTTLEISLAGKLRYTSNCESFMSSSGRQSAAPSVANAAAGNINPARIHFRFFIWAEVHVIRQVRVKRTLALPS